MSLLSARGLTKRFGGLCAVDGVDFELGRGEIRALIGPNGAGKSTFVGLICGRIEASGGQVFFDGQDITHWPAHKRIGLGMAYTFQITSIFANLPVKENVALAARRIWPSHAALVAEKSAQALELVGLAGRQDVWAGDLSYGHQRLLEIAMGIVQEPRLLILDEPTQGLAESEIKDFTALIRGLSATATILLIEHNMQVVMEVAQIITVLDSGRILAQGTPPEIKADRAVQDAYLGAG